MQNPKHKRFTPEEDDIIRQYYPTGGVPECLKYLCDRCHFSINRRANYIGIKYSGPHTRGLKNHIDRKRALYEPDRVLRRERLNSRLGSNIGKPNYHPAKDVGDYKQERK